MNGGKCCAIEGPAAAAAASRSSSSGGNGGNAPERPLEVVPRLLELALCFRPR